MRDITNRNAALCIVGELGRAILGKRCYFFFFLLFIFSFILFYFFIFFCLIKTILTAFLACSEQSSNLCVTSQTATQHCMLLENLALQYSKSLIYFILFYFKNSKSTYSFSCMFRTQRQFMRDVTNSDAALCVVGELCCAVFKQLLLNVVHDV